MAKLKGRRGLVIAIAAVGAVLLGGAIAWVVVDSSSGGRSVSELAATAQQERIKHRIARIERLLVAIDRAGDPRVQAAAKARRVAQRARAARRARAIRRAKAARRAKAREARQLQAAAGGAVGQAPHREESCDPNYEGACLDPNASDYDCSDGSGDGPEYTGTVTVVGDDHYGLDSNDNGLGCEPN